MKRALARGGRGGKIVSPMGREKGETTNGGFLSSLWQEKEEEGVEGMLHHCQTHFSTEYPFHQKEEEGKGDPYLGKKGKCFLLPSPLFPSSSVDTIKFAASLLPQSGSPHNTTNSLSLFLIFSPFPRCASLS